MKLPIPLHFPRYCGQLIGSKVDEDINSNLILVFDFAFNILLYSGEVEDDEEYSGTDFSNLSPKVPGEYIVRVVENIYQGGFESQGGKKIPP